MGKKKTTPSLSVLIKFAGTSTEELSALGLDSQVLKDVYDDYLKRQEELHGIVESISRTLMKKSRVHSVRYRVKDPNHLLQKIVRKKRDTPERIINVENYLNEVTDLVGVRALHLYKESWHVIGSFISETWRLKEVPIAYVRKGDDPFYMEQFEKHGCQVKDHPAGYRSVHYVIETTPNKQKYFAELQVRTIFEEGWSEIDHNIRYPNNENNPIINNFLQILNRLSGSADELGTYIRKLESEIMDMERTKLEALSERDFKIEALQAQIKSLPVEQPVKDKLEVTLSDLVKYQRDHIFASSSFVPPGLAAAAAAMANISNVNSPFASLKESQETLYKALKDSNSSYKRLWQDDNRKKSETDDADPNSDSSTGE